MYRLLLTSLICLGLLAPASASAWWQDDWQYRKQVSVDTTPQGAAINDSLGRLPLLVRLHTGNFTFDGVNENGSDIRFVAADDKTVLRHQVESFDPLMGMALIWVDVPRVEGGQRQDIWMYYGNAKAPESGNGQSVFDPDYTLVYHFDGAPGTPPRDSTAYANNAQTAAGSPVEGVIGRSAQLLGQPLLLPASPSLAVSAGGTFSFSGWVRPDQLAGEQVLLSRREGGNALLVGLAQGAPFVELNGQRAAASQALAQGQWQHLALVADGTRLALYLGGREVASLAAARHVGVMPSQGAAALSEFRNVKRRMEKVAEVRGVTLYDDFAHHPTAIATTLDGLRKQVGADTQVIAIVEPRSNSMKLGAHRDGLPDSVRQADQVLWYAPPNLGWDLAATAAQCAIPSQVCDTLEAIIEQVRQQARPGAQVVIMSNGGFGGLHGKLAAALAE